MSWAEEKKILHLPSSQKSLAILDVYQAHRTPDVLEEFKRSGFLPVFVPGNCTSEMQPLDLAVNCVVKESLHSFFTEWYAEEVYEALSDSKNDIELAVSIVQPDLWLSVLKPIHATWVIKTLSDLSMRHELICADWRKAGITATKKGLHASDSTAVPPPGATTPAIKQEPLDSADDEPTTNLADEAVVVGKAGVSSTDEEPVLQLCSAIWQGTKVHEWTLPPEFSQYCLDGRKNGSTACTVISADILLRFLKGGTDVAQHLPASGQAPSGIVLKLFTEAM